MGISSYYDHEGIRERTERGEHRELVGGLWDEIGHLTFDFLRGRGLKPETYLLDIGCGCLRIGVHLVEFLESQHYFGVDLSEDLLNAGYEVELKARGLQHKLERRNLLCDGDFDFSRLVEAPPFEMALAQSLFTHLPTNHIRLCLSNLAGVMHPRGTFYATIFFCPDEGEWGRALYHERGGITTYPARDPYHYRLSDLRCFVEGLPWSVGAPLDWGHPRNQAMLVFTREEG